jgi:hypothetical protein
MKKLLMSLALIFFVPTFILAQEADESGPKAKEEAAVRQTIQYYFEGYSNQDVVSTSRAFHPQAKYFVVKGGELEEIPQSLVQDNMSIYSQPNPNPDTAPKRIVSVDVSGEVAAVKVEMDYDNGRFTEYLSLLKFQDGWKIVSKITTAGLRCMKSKKPGGSTGSI